MPLSTTSFSQWLGIGYYNWWLVALCVTLVGIFLYGILQPRKKSEWRSAGAAQAWVIALYAEMYGTPLTAWLLMSWLGRPAVDAENHFNGHAWPLLLGIPESYVLMAQVICTVVGQLLILGGTILAVAGWRQLHRAARDGEMVTGGLYRWIRHPQYTGFFMFLIGSVINWPTLFTILTLPILSFVYWRLARQEEQDALQQFGNRYRHYMASTGRFLPVPLGGSSRVC